MHDLMRRLHVRYRSGTLLISHDIDEALALADRVLVLTDGMISDSVTIENVAKPLPQPGQPRARVRYRLLEALGRSRPCWPTPPVKASTSIPSREPAMAETPWLSRWM